MTTTLNEESRTGIIYKLEGYGLTYIGSTIQNLADRKYTHKSQYKTWIKNEKKGWNCASYIILEKGDDWTITGIEYILTDTKKTGLLELEQLWIEKTCQLIGKDKLTNVNQALQSIEDLTEYKRQWAETDRRAKGVPVKEKILTLDIKKYGREKMAEYRAKRTPEEVLAENLKRRLERPEQTEEQKQKARERAAKQRNRTPEEKEKFDEMRRLKYLEKKEEKKEKK